MPQRQFLSPDSPRGRQGAGTAALGGFTSSTWGWRQHPACPDSDPLPPVCSRAREPAHALGAAPELGSTQLGPLCPAAAKAVGVPPLGMFPVKALSQRSRRAGSTRCRGSSRHSTILSCSHLNDDPAALSDFPESPVLFRLCSDSKNAITSGVQTRTAHQRVSPVIKHTE